MPLPLPNLDTRRWRDLIDEGRALIPRYAAAWTDHNVHDPGIMLMELLAWLVEGLIYRANRIPERNRRKFLALIGYAPEPPQPAATVLSCAVVQGTGAMTLPAGTVFLAGGSDANALPFSTTLETTLVEAALVALQQFDGAKFVDRTRMLRATLPFQPFGPNPTVPSPYDAELAPAFYIGFDTALPLDTVVSLYVALDGSVADERQRLIDEAAEQAKLCLPEVPKPKCKPCPTPDDPWSGTDEPDADAGSGTAPPASVPPHHSVTVAWEFLAADGWHELSADAGEIDDQTRALTLDGAVRIRVPPPVAMADEQVGAVADARFWVRCRLVSGRYDASPEIIALLHNALPAEQSLPAYATYVVAAGVVEAGTPTPGTVQSMALQFDSDGAVQSLGVLLPADPGFADAPRALVLDFVPATTTTTGSLVLALERVLAGNGFPDQHATLTDAPVTRGMAEVWTIEGDAATRWNLRPDFDSSGWADATAVLDADSGALTFGNGARGRVPPGESSVLVAHASTSADAGNVAARLSWTIADTPINTALLGSSAVVAASLASIVNPLAATGGAVGESIDDAAERAAESLWAHERLALLCAAPGCDTLDQLDSNDVLALTAPERATTTLDFERIARDVPGTRVQRARAWAQIDPDVPGALASGTVTLVIVPSLPLGRPTPSAGLLRAVRSYLDRRRVLCTRLLVVAPEYVVVSVSATVQALRGADATRVASDIRDALAQFFDPLTGGPAGRGWPFGRDVFRSEVLALIDGVDGVDHVQDLTLTADGAEPTCGNVCVAPTRLVASGTHTIQVQPA